MIQKDVRHIKQDMKTQDIKNLAVHGTPIAFCGEQKYNYIDLL